jgi:hypothetical protein
VLVLLALVGLAGWAVGPRARVLVHLSRAEIAECEAVREALVQHGDHLDAQYCAVPSNAIEAAVAAVASLVPIERVARLYLASRKGDTTIDELELARITPGFEVLADEAGAWSWGNESRFTAGTLPERASESRVWGTWFDPVGPSSLQQRLAAGPLAKIFSHASASGPGEIQLQRLATGLPFVAYRWEEPAGDRTRIVEVVLVRR